MRVRLAQDADIVLSSDPVELEEHRAVQPGYWSSPTVTEAMDRVQAIYSSQPVASTSRLPSPTRHLPWSPPSAVASSKYDMAHSPSAAFGPSPPLSPRSSRASQRIDSLPSKLASSPLPDATTMPSSLPSALRTKRATSPIHCDGSSPLHSLPSSSPLPDAAVSARRSPSPRPMSPSVLVIDSPPRRSASHDRPPSPLAAGRALRARTAVQQNPFTAEHARYQTILHRNGWDDAVLRLPKAKEETPEERAARLAEAKRREKDDLDGWLVLEDGSRVRREGYVALSARSLPPPSDDDSEVDFDDLLQGRHRAEKAASGHDKQTRPRLREYGSDNDRLRQALGSHARQRSATRPRPGKRRRQDSHEPDIARPDRRSRSEPPSSSTPPATKSRPMVIDTASDDSDSSPAGPPSRRPRSAPRRERSAPAAADPSGLKGKRKKALGAMMPAAFFKRAKQDLELMRQERINISDGSGADDASSSSADEDGRRKKGKARVRRRALESDEETGIAFAGEAFTDESGGDRAASSESEEDEAPVVDAVSNWLGAFAPKRRGGAPSKGGGGGGRDFLDKLLVQSKSSTRRPAKKVTRAPKQPRLPFTERHHLGQGPVVVQHKGNAAARAKGPPIAVDPDSLFLGRAAIPSIDVDALPAQNQATDNWDAFTRFSHDFGVQRLPSGLAFSRDSYIGRGYLRDLTDAVTAGDVLPTPFRATIFPFGFTLDGEMTTNDLVNLLPSLCDRLFAEIECAGRGDGQAHLVADAAEVLRWLGGYITAHRDDAAFTSEVYVQTGHLRQRLESVASTERTRLCLQWAFLELDLRNPDRLEAAKLDSRDALATALLQQNVTHAAKALKAAAPGEALDATSSDALFAVDLWVRLIRIAIASDSTEALWRAVGTASEDRARRDKLHPIQATEALAYAAMTICACSQFATTGVVSSTPSLPAFWPAVTTALSRISPAALAEDSSKLSNTALQRRDGYVSALFARCLVFVERWGWKVDGREGLVVKLFDVLNGRLLSRLATDGPRDFPAFLQQYSGTLDTSLDRRGDTAFHIFLKLLVCASRDQAGATEGERRKGFSKLISRITPQRKLPFTRDATSNRVTLDRSTLVNHYSLFMILAICAPASAGTRLGQIRNLLAFEEADDEARLVCLRAIMYLAIVYRHLDIDLAPILAWLAHICRFVHAQYIELEGRRRQVGKAAPIQREADALTHDMYAAALTISMILRAVQHILLADASLARSRTLEPPYPDLALLDDAWIKDLLRSPLAQDPLIAVELLKCLDCFLNLRAAALAPHEGASGVSQDEFGNLDAIDYDDPVLCAMLGIEPAAPSPTAAEESAFAELAHSVLSPALFRMLIAAYAKETAKSRAAPVVNARVNVSFVDDLVACWARCAIAVVKAGKRDWQQYITWGDEVWKRISDPLGRREVALRFLVHAVEADEKAFQGNKDEYLSVWCQSIVAKRPSLQHRLTSAILNHDDSPTLLGDDGIHEIPFTRDADSGRFGVTAKELEAKRLALLEVVVLRARRVVVNAGVAGRTALTHLGSLCTAMRDNLESFDVLDGLAKAAYAKFARQTAIQLQSMLGPATTASMPAHALLLTALDKADAAAL